MVIWKFLFKEKYLQITTALVIFVPQSLKYYFPANMFNKESWL